MFIWWPYIIAFSAGRDVGFAIPEVAVRVSFSSEVTSEVIMILQIVDVCGVFLVDEGTMACGCAEEGYFLGYGHHHQLVILDSLVFTLPHSTYELFITFGAMDRDRPTVRNKF